MRHVTAVACTVRQSFMASITRGSWHAPFQRSWHAPRDRQWHAPCNRLFACTVQKVVCIRRATGFLHAPGNRLFACAGQQVICMRRATGFLNTPANRFFACTGQQVVACTGQQVFACSVQQAWRAARHGRTICKRWRGHGAVGCVLMVMGQGLLARGRCRLNLLLLQLQLLQRRVPQGLSVCVVGCMGCVAVGIPCVGRGGGSGSGRRGS